MTRAAYRLVFCIGCVVALAGTLPAAVPPAGPNPLTWQFTFDYSIPKRLVITPRGADKAQAYWYVTYTISNRGRQAEQFNPIFEMVTDDGLVIRSDDKRYEMVDGQVREVKRTLVTRGAKNEITERIPQDVLTTIRDREKNPSLQSVNQISGPLRAGPDEARQGVAIFPEPKPRMGQFSIFVAGLSGDLIDLKKVGTDYVERKKDEMPASDDVILRRTYQIRCQVLGDDKYPGEHRLERVGEGWVYR
jgi:hypothetical protein